MINEENFHAFKLSLLLLLLVQPHLPCVISIQHGLVEGDCCLKSDSSFDEGLCHIVSSWQHIIVFLTWLNKTSLVLQNNNSCQTKTLLLSYNWSVGYQSIAVYFHIIQFHSKICHYEDQLHNRQENTCFIDCNW